MTSKNCRSVAPDAAPSKAALNELEIIRRRVFSSALRIWDRLLSSEQRRSLGDKFSFALAEGRGIVRLCVDQHGGGERGVIRVARRLGFLTFEDESWLLREFGYVFDDLEDSVQRALKRFDLVVTETPRGVFWKGEVITVDWDRANSLWNYFCALVEARRKSEPLTRDDLGGDLAPDSLSKLKSDLIRNPAFPQSLAERIKAIRPYRQQLDVDASRICIITTDAIETHSWT